MAETLAKVPASVLEVPRDARERIAEAAANLLGRKIKPTVTKVREKAGCSMGYVSAVMRAYRQGALPHPATGWGAELEPDAPAEGAERAPADLMSELAGLIADCDSADKREAVLRKLAVAQALGAIDHREATALKQTLSEHRQTWEQAKEHAEGDLQQRIILCTDEGWRVLRVFEGIVGDDLRQACIDFVAAQAERDLRDNPNVDQGG